MAHCTVPEAEQILDKEFPVLDKGFTSFLWRGNENLSSR
jgi:hypothetical protein